MKKVILGLVMASTLVTFNVQAKSRTTGIITANIGTIENTDTDKKENIYGLSYYKIKRNGGIAYNLDYFKNSDDDLETLIVSPSVGYLKKISNNLYIIPSSGLSYLDMDGIENGNNYSENDWGYNFGLDLIYKTNSGFTFGAGARYLKFDKDDYLQFQGKIGF